MNYQLAATLGAAILFSGCTMGPNYRRPAVAVPDAFRSPVPLLEAEANSLGDLKWWEVFKDEQLQGLVKAALAGNFDLRDAVARIDEARANLGVTRSEQFPQLSATGRVSYTRLSRGGQSPLPESFLPSPRRDYGQLGLSLLSFELDLWGRLRRATEAARATLLGTEEYRKAVITTLVSDVATAYLNLRERDYELEVSRRTLETRRKSLDLIRLRQQGGIATLLELRQGEQLVESAAQTIPLLQQDIEQTENSIRLLLGQNPGDVVRGRSFLNQDLPPQVPAGIPSALLERRPDIRVAEQDLISANAQIGVAKAAYFPQISMSGFSGGQSQALRKLFSDNNRSWNFIPEFAQPIFTAGRLRSNVRLTEAQRNRAIVAYEKAIQTAFSEVSNSLIANQRTRESRERQQALVTVLEDRKRLSYVRYQGGVDTLLSALDSDRDLFQAELTLAQVRLDESLSVVQLYKALGGGWN